MIGTAACRGAVTIVNAIATGRGCAFGIDLEVDAEVRIEDGCGELTLDGPQEGLELARGCVGSVAGRPVGGSVTVRSSIPMSRGLKSSSASSNAIVLAASRALDVELDDMDILMKAIEESINAGVTITGALDDSSACFYGGVAITDNRARRILHRDTIDDDLRVVVHVPERSISKREVQVDRFQDARDEFEEAFALASKGEYLRAIRVNSRACSKVLDLSEEAAETAVANGALTAGITGTGPATAALCRHADEERVARALDELGGEVIRAGINTTCSREVVPRLL